MKKRMFYGSIATVILIIIVIVIMLFGPTSISQTITLPSPNGANSANNAENGTNRIEVTSETVQSVLKTLTRSEAFTRTYAIKTYWNGGESESTLNLWQKDKLVRMSITENNAVKNILISGNELAVWYDGSSNVFTSKLSESKVSTEVDMFSRLVTYEDIYEILPENITDADYIEKLGQPCIFTEYKSGDLDYVNQVYISIDSGLLVALYKFDGDTPIYSMESVSTELSTPSDDVFTVPTT